MLTKPIITEVGGVYKLFLFDTGAGGTAFCFMHIVLAFRDGKR